MAEVLKVWEIFKKFFNIIFYIQSLNSNDGTDLLIQNIARIQVFFWLGLKSESSIIQQLLPNGYETTDVVEWTGLPRQIRYTGKHDGIFY